VCNGSCCGFAGVVTFCESIRLLVMSACVLSCLYTVGYMVHQHYVRVICHSCQLVLLCMFRSDPWHTWSGKTGDTWAASRRLWRWSESETVEFPDLRNFRWIFANCTTLLPRTIDWFVSCLLRRYDNLWSLISSFSSHNKNNWFFSQHINYL